eukprot:4153458-Pleurochrysis_carterae.AAC.1
MAVGARIDQHPHHAPVAKDARVVEQRVARRERRVLHVDFERALERLVPLLGAHASKCVGRRQQRCHGLARARQHGVAQQRHPCLVRRELVGRAAPAERRLELLNVHLRSLVKRAPEIIRALEVRLGGGGEQEARAQRVDSLVRAEERVHAHVCRLVHDREHLLAVLGVGEVAVGGVEEHGVERRHQVGLGGRGADD